MGRDTVTAAGLGAVGFVLGTPFALLTPVAFVRGVLDEVREVNTVQFGNEADVPGYLFHLAYSLPQAMGWPLYLLALAGLGWALARREAREAILLAFAVPYLLVIVTWSSRFERYVIPLLPCLTLLAAAVVVRGRGLAVERRAARPGAVARPRAGGRGGAARRAGAGARRRSITGCSRARTRACSAPEWVERHVPPGTRIALEPFSLRLPVARGQLKRGARKRGASAAAPTGCRAAGVRRALTTATGWNVSTCTTSIGCSATGCSTWSCRASCTSDTARPATVIPRPAGSTGSSRRGRGSCSAPRPASRTPG